MENNENIINDITIADESSANTKVSAPAANVSPKELAEKIIAVLDSKKAGGMKLLHVEEQTVLTDYFVICSGSSNTQIKALANEVEFQIGEKLGLHPMNIEGLSEATWVVLDYASVIVHIFNRETRLYYNLEKLWIDSKEIDISGLLADK